jgi:hypothetical protein
VVRLDGHGVAYERGVDELLEADDESAAHHEVVGDTDVDPLAGGLVGRGAAGEDDHVLAVDDVGVVVGRPAVPWPSCSMTWEVTPSGVR